MGQVALGFRSLLVKAAIFVVLAALLAWVLGGTLWPRPHSAAATTVDFSGRSYQWRIYINEHEQPHLWWVLLASHPEADDPEADPRAIRDPDDAEPLIDQRWAEGGILIKSTDNTRLIFAGRALGEHRWTVGSIDADTHALHTEYADTPFDAMERVQLWRTPAIETD